MEQKRLQSLLGWVELMEMKPSELRELANEIEKYKADGSSGFVDYCKNHIAEKIYEFVERSHYGADLAYEITQEENANGTLTFSRDKAAAQLKEWWYDCAEYWQYEGDSFGEHKYNPFSEPEAYMVCMVIEGCASLLGQTELLQSVWNDKFVLTKETADTIVEQVKEIKTIW